MSDRSLRLSASDAGVWKLTMDALAASENVTPLTIRCRCWSTVAYVGNVPGHGPLFTSSWRVVVDPPFVVKVNGERLSPRQAWRHVIDGAEVTGPSPDEYEVHGVIALLALPPDLPQDYPDLMVRCPKGCGDAVLDRYEVIGWLRRDHEQLVQPGDTAQYDRSTLDRDGGVKRRTKVTRRIGGGEGFETVEEMNEFFAGHPWMPRNNTPRVDDHG